MSNEIKVAAQGSGEDSINRLTLAVDALTASMSKLGSGNAALEKMQKQMATMTKAMKSGFDELIEIQSVMEARSQRQAEMAGVRALAQAKARDERALAQTEVSRDRQLNADRVFVQAHEAMQERQLSADVAFSQASAKVSARLAGQRALDHDREQQIEQKWLAQLTAEREKQLSMESVFEREAARIDSNLARQRALDHDKEQQVEQKWLAMLEADREKALAIEVAFSRAVEQVQAKRVADAVSAADRQRALNTNFLTSPLTSQIGTAERAAVYTSLGGNASERFGSAAAAADIAALRAQHALLPAAVQSSTNAINGHNAAMNEAHALARGLAGSLGGLWLTYGSLVPLAAGAALAGSLKAVVEQGRQVEYQLKFVEALGGGQVSLDRLLHITDQTVVSVREAAEGMRALAQNGLSASESLKVLPSLLNLSVIGEMSVSQAALAVTGAISAFGLKLEDVDHVANVFAQAAATSNTSVIAMTESMKQGSTVASIYGASIEQAAAVMGVLAKNNIIGGSAGTAYTNMLSGLFAPTEKAKKALAELGIVTDDGNGHLKDQTVLLNEINAALNRYNDTARTTFMADIWTVRGTKSADAILKNLDEYKKKVREAEDVTNYMGLAVSVLEDSTTGAFKRLSNSVSSSLDRAFESSAPALQSLVTGLAHAAKDPGVVATLTNMADAVLRLTTFIFDHTTAITTAGVAYIAMRVAVSVLPAALTEASIAVGVFGLSVKTALGPVGLFLSAIAAAIAIYELFINKTSDVEKSDKRIQNSIQGTIEYLDREISALKERNRLRDDPGAAKTIAGGVTEAEANLHGKRAELARLNALIAAPVSAGGMPASERLQADRRAATPDYLRLVQQITQAEKDLGAVRAKGQELQAGLADEQTSKARAKLLASMDEIVKMGETHHKGEAGALNAAFLGNANEALYAKTQEMAKIKDLYAKGQITENEAIAKRNAIRDAASSMLESRAPREDKKAAGDALKAQISENELIKQKFEIMQKTELLQLESDRKSGAVGDISYLERKVDLQKAGYAEAEKVARMDRDAVTGLDNKLAATQKYTNLVETNKLKSTEADAQLKAEKSGYLSDLQQKADKQEAENLAKKGQLVDAYALKFQTDNGRAIAAVSNDLQKLSLESATAALAIDPSNVDRLRDYNTALAQTKFLRDKMSEASEGGSTALFGESKSEFDKGLAQLQERLSSAKATAAEDGGISGALGLAAAAEDIRGGLLPALQQMVNQLQVVAKDSKIDSLTVAADKAKDSLNTITKELTKSASPFGNAWTDAWKGVESAGHRAWTNLGKGGTNMAKEIGAALKTSVLEMLYQLTIKKWVVSIGATLGEAYGLTSPARVASTAGSLLTSTGSAGNLVSTVAGISSGSNMFGSLASGSGVAGQFLSGASGSAAAAAEALGAEMTTAAAAGSALGTAFSAAIPWVAAAGLAFAAWNAFFEDGPEANTRLGFTSNSTAGNISINERGNEGKSDRYIAGASTTSALGTFGVNSTFWMAADSPVVKSFLETVGKTDDALAMFMTAAEKTAVSGYLTGRSSTANTGAEGSNPNANGALDSVFRARISNIFDGLSAGMSALLKDFNGTSQELATEASAVLAFRQALVDSGSAVFGLKVSLEEVAALKLPTEATSDALTRVTNTFVTTNQVASIMGKSVEQMFGSLGLSSFAARDKLVSMTGGLATLSSQVTSYSTNFLTKAEQLSPAAAAVTKTMADLGLASVTTRAAFVGVVKGLDLTKDSDIKLFASLMGVQQAFSDVTAAAETASTSAKTLQDQIDQLVMNRAQLLQKERDALDPANRALFDNLQLQKKLADARTDVATAYANEVTAITAANERLLTFGASLRSFRDGLLLGNLSPLTPEQKYSAARSQYDVTLAKAKAGDLKAQDALQGAASAFLEASRVSNASGSTYTSDFQRVTDAMGQMAVWADQQVDVGMASLDQLKKQVSALVDIKDAVLTLPQALKALMEANNPAPDQSQRDAVTSLYKDVLGRAPDATGFAYWLSIMKAGASASYITGEMKNSPEYVSSHSASAYDYTAGTASAVFVDMAAELRALKQQIKDLQDAATADTGAQMGAMFASSASNAATIAAAIEESAREVAWAKQNEAKVV